MKFPKPTQKELDKEFLESMVAKLLENFDSVQIFATSHNGATGETLNLTAGGGNYYARLGQIKNWLMKKDQDDKRDSDQEFRQFMIDNNCHFDLGEGEDEP